MRAIGERASREAKGPVVGARCVGEAAAVDRDLHRAETYSVGGRSCNANGARDGGAAVRGSDSNGRLRRTHVDGKVGGGGIRGSVLDLHREGESPCDRRSSRNRPCVIQSKPFRQSATGESPGIRRRATGSSER